MNKNASPNCPPVSKPVCIVLFFKKDSGTSNSNTIFLMPFSFHGFEYPKASSNLDVTHVPCVPFLTGKFSKVSDNMVPF